MPNYSTPNNGYIIILVLLFFTPIVLHYLTKLFEDNRITIKIYEPAKPRTFTMEDVRKRAMEDAVYGDRYARDWLTKTTLNAKTCYDGANRTKKKVAETPPKVATDLDIINEAIEALCALKVQKAIATKIIMSLATNKKYTDVSTLIIEAFKYERK